MFKCIHAIQSDGPYLHKYGVPANITRRSTVGCEAKWVLALFGRGLSLLLCILVLARGPTDPKYATSTGLTTSPVHEPRFTGKYHVQPRCWHGCLCKSSARKVDSVAQIDANADRLGNCRPTSATGFPRRFGIVARLECCENWCTGPKHKTCEAMIPLDGNMDTCAMRASSAFERVEVCGKLVCDKKTHRARYRTCTMNGIWKS